MNKQMWKWEPQSPTAPWVSLTACTELQSRLVSRYRSARFSSSLSFESALWEGKHTGAPSDQCLHFFLLIMRWCWKVETQESKVLKEWLSIAVHQRRDTANVLQRLFHFWVHHSRFETEEKAVVAFLRTFVLPLNEKKRQVLKTAAGLIGCWSFQLVPGEITHRGTREAWRQQSFQGLLWWSNSDCLCYEENLKRFWFLSREAGHHWSSMWTLTVHWHQLTTRKYKYGSAGLLYCF